ncbi:hypothetical protein Tco_0826653 [Tanacetum coccineum]
MLQAPIEGYGDAIVVPPINANNFALKQPLINLVQSNKFTELHQLDTFYNSLTNNDQDALDSAAGGNFLDKMPREGLAIIESKSKVRYLRSRPNDSRAITNAPSSTSSPSNNSFEIQQMAALLEDKMNIRMSRLEKAISEKNATTPATVKAVEEVSKINAISQERFIKTLEGPSTPLVPTPVVLNPQKELELNPETSTGKVQNPNLENTAHVPPPEEEESIFIEIPKPKAKKIVNVEIQDLNSRRPIPSKLPYPERMKVRENDKPSAQHSRFLKMFKQLHLEIGLKDGSWRNGRSSHMVKTRLLRINKEKLPGVAITSLLMLNVPAIIMSKFPRKLEDSRKITYSHVLLQELQLGLVL